MLAGLTPDDFRLFPTVSVQTSKHPASETDFLHQGQVSVCHYTDSSRGVNYIVKKIEINST